MARKRPPPTADANLLGLVQACKDEPDDDGLRGILADYLEDHGQRGHGEFVRHSVLADHPGEDRASAAGHLACMGRLYARHRVYWPGRFAGTQGVTSFWRGLVTLRADVATLRGPKVERQILDCVPWIERLVVDYRQPRQILLLSELALLALFTGIKFIGPRLTSEAVKALARAPYLAPLRELSLEFSQRQSGAIEPLLAEIPALAGLRSLTIDGSFSAKSLRNLANAPFAPSLRSLSLACGSSSPPWPVLGRGEKLLGLRRLALRGGQLDAPGVAALVDSGGLAGLRELVIHGTQLGDDGLEALASSPALARLESLTLWDSGSTGQGVNAILASPHLGGLRHLAIGANRLHTDRLRTLAEGETLPRLESLTLAAIYDPAEAGALALFQSERFPSLRDLALSSTQVTPRGLAALVRGPLASCLRCLSLNTTEISTEGARLLAKADSLHALEALELDHCDLGDEGVLALAKSTTLHNLAWLAISGSSPLEAGLMALAARDGLPGLMFLRVASYGSGAFAARATHALQMSPRLATGFFVDVPTAGSMTAFPELACPFRSE